MKREIENIKKFAESKTETAKLFMILNYVSTIISITLIKLLSIAHVANSDTERSMFVFACWVVLFFLFLLSAQLFSKKMRRGMEYIVTTLLLDGILLFTTAVVAIAIHGATIGQSNFSLSLITHFSLYYFVFALIVKFLARSRYVVIVILSGLFLPLILGFVGGIVNFIFLLFSNKNFDIFLLRFFRPFFFLDLAITIGTTWYFVLEKNIYRISRSKE